MARGRKSSFVNRVALQKAIRSISATSILKAVDPIYKRGSKKFRDKARRNAPIGNTGRLARNIGIASKSNPRAGRGSLAKYTIYSRSIQDMVMTHGIQDEVIRGVEATKRSRTINGRKHRLKSGFNYTKGLQRTKKTNKISKRQPLDKNGRPWAFGKRKANPFMTRDQFFPQNLEDMSAKIGNRIRKQIADQFAKNVKLKVGRR